MNRLPVQLFFIFFFLSFLYSGNGFSIVLITNLGIYANDSQQPWDSQTIAGNPGSFIEPARAGLGDGGVKGGESATCAKAHWGVTMGKSSHTWFLPALLGRAERMDLPHPTRGPATYLDGTTQTPEMHGG